MIPVIIDELGTVLKGWEKRLGEFDIRGKIDTIKTTALLKSARILVRVLETWEYLLSLYSNEKPLVADSVKKN